MRANDDTPAGEKDLSTDPDDHADRSLEKLRGGARRIRADLEDLADELEAGSADAEDVYQVVAALAHTYVDVEDAAADTGAIDAEAPPARAANESRKVLFHIAHGDPTAAMKAATTAAEYADRAREEEGVDE